MKFKYLNHSLKCQEIQNGSWLMNGQGGITASIELYEAVGMILAIGALTILVAWASSALQKHVSQDQLDHLDASLDAGGNVNAGLTATTVVSHWTWAATLLQSTTVAAKYGISGSFWYAAGATIQILLFSMLAVQIKTRAPGAKTFLQVIRARFGKRCHVVFCFYALGTNIIVTAMLMLGGSAVITSLVKSMSMEYSTMLMALVIGGYTLLGGLGATFYVHYFCSAIIYLIIAIFMCKVFEDDGPSSSNALGDAEKVFAYVSCSKGPDGNRDASYLTIISNQGLMFGVINIVGNFGAVFVDQSYWQSVIASKPKQGVMGFLLGGLAWFAIPFSFSTAMGLAYVALCAEQGHELLNEEQVNSGLISALVVNRLLGKSGELALVAMVLLSVTSTAASEVLAVTSIVVYDIYAVHLKPYRLTTDTNSCILCGRGRGRLANPRDRCTCVSMTFCEKCQQDNIYRSELGRLIKPDYKCAVHSGYRLYNDYLRRMKNWTVMWTTLGIIPFTIFLSMSQIALNWMYLFMGVLIGSAVVPISLTMFWDRLTKEGIMVGTFGGTLLAFSVWLGVASTFEGGLSEWWINTGQEVSMLSGNLAAIFGGAIITVVCSLLTNLHSDADTRAEIWENTRDIDNPLSPWMEKYKKELNLPALRTLEDRPSLQCVQDAFKGAKTMSFLSTIISLVLVIVWPSVMVAVDVMTYQQFQVWVKLSECWLFLAMLVMILLPLVIEVSEIWAHLKDRRKVTNHHVPRPDFHAGNPANEVQETRLSNRRLDRDVQ